MGRSVSFASGSTAVAYRTLEVEPWVDDDGEEHLPSEDDFHFEFEYLVDFIRERAKELWPSFVDHDEWVDREDHAILINDFAKIGISEYCGLVSVWLLPRTDDHGYHSTANLCEPWCERIANKFREEFGALRRLGTFSNGEAVFERMEA